MGSGVVGEFRWKVSDEAEHMIQKGFEGESIAGKEECEKR